MSKHFRKEYMSIPNLMGYFRIVLVAVYLHAFVNSMKGGAYWPVIAIIVLSGVTDFLDGKIARKFNMVTDWGKILDPVADKITLGAIILSLAFKYKAVVAMIVLYVIKEGYMGVAGLYMIKKGYKVEGAKWYGKFCTFATYVILILLLLIPEMPLAVVNILVVADMAVMVFTLINYIIYYSTINKNTKFTKHCKNS